MRHVIDLPAFAMGAALAVAVLLAAWVLGSALAEGSFVLWVCGAAIAGIAVELWRTLWDREP